MPQAIPIKVQGILCLLLAIGLLIFGLWPFHAPLNDVGWTADGRGAKFKGNSIILSSGELQQSSPNCSIETSITPNSISDTHSFFTFYVPRSETSFFLQQYFSALIVQREGGGTHRRILEMDGLLGKDRPAFVAVTISALRTGIYIDGKLIRFEDALPDSETVCSGLLAIGGSPSTKNTWHGVMRGLAIYGRELTGMQIASDYEYWTRLGAFQFEADENPIAGYRFDQKSASVIPNDIRGGVDLNIPRRYQLPNQIFLESPFHEYSGSYSYFGDVIVNIGGFVPAGWFFCNYWSRRRRSIWLMFATVLFGAAISLTIEVTQWFLPTRASSLTDVTTNTLGTIVGVLLWRTGLVQSWLESRNWKLRTYLATD